MGSRLGSQDVYAQCLAFRSRRLSRLITRLYDQALRPLEITAAQFTLLAALDISGPVAAARIGRTLDLEKSTLSRNLARMEQAKWIVDREGWMLTASGKKAFARGLVAWEEAHRRAQEVLGPRAAVMLEGMIAGLSDPSQHVKE